MDIQITVRKSLLGWLAAGFILFSGCDASTNEPGPDVPTLTAPQNGSSNELSVVELQWNTAATSVTYQLQLARDPGFNSMLIDENGISGNGYPLYDLELGKDHFWRIRAHNESGFSDWSEIRKFKPSKEAVIPTTPALVAPADNSLDMPTEVFFSWDAVPGASSYHLQVSLEENFIRRSADMEGVRETTQLVRQLVPTYIYYWRVRAINPLGHGNWSPTWVLVVEDDL